MILMIDTSKPECEISIFKKAHFDDYKWFADRKLADDLLKNISKRLKENNLSFENLKALGVFEGPGSFTGLRIGITVMNTIADSLDIPIYGARGDDWKNEIISKFEKEKKSELILPFYGADAKITLPKK